MSKQTALIVEDSFSLAQIYAGYLQNDGYATVIADCARAAEEQLAKQSFTVVVLDLGLPDADGIDLLRHIRSINLATAVVVVTANASIAKAVQAVREGAQDYLVKPVTRDRLVATLAKSIAAQKKLKPQAKAPIEETTDFHGLVGRSPVMRQLFKRIEKVAHSRAPAFITGESGTGKELCAEAIHRLSGRASGPFVPINCGAIPKELMESEIFGHLKGSFTGAISDRDGAARLADGGTLFLDEVCEMDLTLQTKLLRFLQTGLVHRVGAPSAEKVDMRIVCATNRNPAEAVRAGQFRTDLFYRLHVLPIHMPALRERGGDIILLAQHFLMLTASEEHKEPLQISDGASAALLAYQWPGNVRELQNTVRQAVVLHEGPMLETFMLPDYIQSLQGQPAEIDITSLRSSGAGYPRPNELWKIERGAIERAIESCGGSIPKAAKLLGVSPSTLYRKREAWAASPPN
jgi:two-component system repressor protein LuxO